MNCSQCGEDGQGGFCANCGTRLGQPEPQPTSFSDPVVTRGVPNDGDTAKGVSARLTAWRNPRALTAVGVAVLIVGVLIVAGISALTRPHGPQGQVPAAAVDVPAAPDPIAVARTACYADVGNGVDALVSGPSNMRPVQMQFGSQSVTFRMIIDIFGPVAREQMAQGVIAATNMKVQLIHQECDAANPESAISVPATTASPDAAPVPSEAPPAPSKSPAPLTMGVGPQKIGCNIGASACAFENGIAFADLYKQVGAAYTRKTGDGVDVHATDATGGVNCDSGQPPNHVPVGKQFICKISGSVAGGTARITVMGSRPFWHLDSILLIPEGP